MINSDFITIIVFRLFLFCYFFFYFVSIKFFIFILSHFITSCEAVPVTHTRGVFTKNAMET